LQSKPERLQDSAQEIPSKPGVGESPTNFRGDHNVGDYQIGYGQIEYKQVDAQFPIAVLDKRNKDRGVANARYHKQNAVDDDHHLGAHIQLRLVDDGFLHTRAIAQLVA